jgi:5-oxoprolinase (ATP-hydrolysing) subunit C
VVPGRRPADAAARTAGALTGEWRVDPQSNRVGFRLAGVGQGPAVCDGSPSTVSTPAPSRGMVTGVVQRPPGGELVVLGPDHATVGGYPVVAVVCSADLFRLAHLPPGSVVRFEVVDHAEAAAALVRQQAAVTSAVEGWYPTRAG